MPKERKKIVYCPEYKDTGDNPGICHYCTYVVYFHQQYRTADKSEPAPHSTPIYLLDDPRQVNHHANICQDQHNTTLKKRVKFALLRKEKGISSPWDNGRYIFNEKYYVDGLRDETRELPVYDITRVDHKGEYIKIGHMVDSSLVFIDPNIPNKTVEARANIVENDVKSRQYQYHPLMEEKEITLPEANVIIGNELIDTVKRLERDMSETTIKLETLREALNDYVKMSLDGLQTLSKLVRNSDIKFDETLEPWTKEEVDKNDSN